MKVLKFGGSSLATGERIKNVAQIIIKSKTKKNQLLVVVSAFGGITDLLIRCGQLAQSGNNQYEQLLFNISERCIQINNELFPQNSENTLLEKFLKELERVLILMVLITTTFIYSFGIGRIKK